MPQSKEQIAAYNEEYNEKNKERLAAYNKEYREKNKERLASWSKEYYEKNKERIITYAKEYREENKEEIAIKKEEQRLKSKYGITSKEKNVLLQKQNNKCKICLVEFSNVTPNVDHCHTTNKIRGLLCRACNTGLGQFKDNTKLLTKAINYLEEHNEPIKK